MRRLLPLFCLTSSLLNAIPCTPYVCDGRIYKEYQELNRYVLEDTSENVVYYQWDNTTPGDYDSIVDDPFLIIRTKLGGPEENFDLMRSWSNAVRFSHFSYPPSQSSIDESLPDTLAARESLPQPGSPDVVFNYTSPEFDIPSASRVWWQICDQDSFDRIIPNLNRQVSNANKATLDPIANTFLNPDRVYYFRHKSEEGGEWSEWSEPISFRVVKPEAVKTPYFEAGNPLRISWEAEPDTRYLVFASNAIDFVPDIYSEEQLNGVDENGACSTGSVTNLVAITEKSEIEVDDSLCFYRIIAERGGTLSTPSRLIYVYSRDQVPQRTALQPLEQNPNILQRQLFPADHTAAEVASIPMFLRTTRANVRPSHVPIDIWKAVQPWIMPLNHAARGPLDRIFSKRRVLHDAHSLEKAGFTNTTPGNGSQTIVTLHPKVDHYIMKLYLDSQSGVSDWQSWIHRASGADQTREAIVAHKFYPYVVVPYKWIYPLPATPMSEPDREGKNFILVVDKMPVISKKESIHRWYKDMNKDKLKAIYTLTEELGLVNCSQANNLRWEHYLRIVLCDFEHHHIWPTHVENLSAWLRPDMQAYLNELITGKK